MSLSLQLKRARKFANTLTRPRQFSALMMHGVLAGNEHLGVLASNINLVVDIGANRGQFALAVRAKLPNARIVSFEPLPEPAATFRRVFDGDSMTELHECAVGNCHEHRLMNVSKRDDSSSLLTATAIQNAHYPGTEAVAMIEVEIAPLNHFLSPDSVFGPALLKIDVQGAEHETLLGCEALLSAFDYIYCECSFVPLYQGQHLASTVICWLDARGFDLIDVHTLDRAESGQALQADFLFRSRSSSR